MRDAIHREIVNRGMESLAHLPGVTREIDHRRVRIGAVDDEAVRLKPARDLREILFGQSVALAELLRREPLMVIRRVGIFEFIEIFFERALLLGAAPQLEHHVLHREVGGNRAAVVSRRRFGTRIACERDQRILVDRGGDEHRRLRAATEGRSHAGK